MTGLKGQSIQHGPVLSIKQYLKKFPFVVDAIKKTFAVFRTLSIFFELRVQDLLYPGALRHLEKIKKDLSLSHFPKIAFVKQEVLALLYCCPGNSSPRELIFSTLKHTGPVGLFTKLNADLYIVKTEDAYSECQTWKELVTGSKISSVEELESLKTRPFRNGARGHRHAPGEFSVRSAEIDWGRYDWVISMDISVPSHRVRLFPKTTWLYCIAEPAGMPSYKKSHLQPLAGYDLFLNQKFRRFPIGNRHHEVEFPLNLDYYGCFHDLLKIPVDAAEERKGIFIESHTAQVLSPDEIKALENYGEIKVVSAGTEDIVKDLMTCKYFIRLGGRGLWGNAMSEAIAAGCLVLADATEFSNRGLFLSEHHVSSFDSLLQCLSKLNADPSRYNASVSKQRSLLDYLCFYRPLLEVLNKSRSLPRRQGEQRRDP